MALDKWLVRGLGLLLVGGCSSGGTGSGGTASPSSPQTFDYSNQVVRLDTDLVIPTGKTVRVGPGVTFTAAANVKIKVEGTLDVEGSVSAPARFLGDDVDASNPNSWTGIEIESGGNLELSQADIEGAEYGIHAMPGSAYAVDYAVFGTSFKPAVLESDGSFNHCTFHASTPPSVALTLAVTIDDPNGTMTILNASPSVTNSFFEGSSAATDMVRVGGNSVPVFDHDHFTGAHCAFHVYGVYDNAPRVTNSIIENMSYGAMAFSSKIDFEHCNFLNNTNDVGYCLGAKTADAPTLAGNYYLAGDAAIDATCFQVGTKATATSSSPVEGAGPVGL